MAALSIVWRIERCVFCGRRRCDARQLTFPLFLKLYDDWLTSILVGPKRRRAS
jgi:hypothetical protein